MRSSTQFLECAALVSFPAEENDISGPIAPRHCAKTVYGSSTWPLRGTTLHLYEHYVKQVTNLQQLVFRFRGVLSNSNYVYNAPSLTPTRATERHETPSFGRVCLVRETGSPSIDRYLLPSSMLMLVIH
jgi:hypothetical protein